MDILDKLTDKLRKHVWCIVAFAAMLIFWIIVFSVSEKGADIASWVSILFAIIVIMYMLIQGHEMRNLIEQGHRIMEAGTGKLERKFDLLGFGGPAPPTESIDPEELKMAPQLQLNTMTCFWFPLLVLYAIVKAYEAGRPLHIPKLATIIFERSAKDRVRGQEIAVFGAIITLSCFLKPESISELLNLEEVRVNQLPASLVAYVPPAVQKRIEDLTTRDRNRLRASKEAVDQWFTAS